MIPEFVTREVLREYRSPMRLNGYCLIGGILPSSYVARRASAGRPAPCKVYEGQKRYRLLDLIALARAEGLAITRTVEAQLSLSIAELRQKRATLERDVQQLTEVRDEAAHCLELSALSKTLTDATLLDEAAIIAGSLLVERVCGVYFLINRGRVVYVGQSVNVFARIAQHRASKTFERVAYVVLPIDRLDIVESLYIHVLRPPLNGSIADREGHRPRAPLRLNDLRAAQR